MNYGLKTGFS